jgi:hypothetical protein
MTTNLNIILRNGVPETSTLQTNREIRDISAVGFASASHSSLITTDKQKHLISRCNLEYGALIFVLDSEHLLE